MKRITLFSGHYGSGKTNISVNYAINMAKSGKTVSVYDMDIVNPYYRTLDAKGMLIQHGIKLVASDFANSNVDLPAVTGEAYSMTADKSHYAVVDIGGDDRGALVLGRYADEIIAENDYEFIYVLNKYRLETSSLAGAKEIFDEIQAVSKIKFTAIASNANLADETTADNVIKGFEFAKEFGKIVNLPVKMTCVSQQLLQKEKFDIDNILSLQLIHYLNFK